MKLVKENRDQEKNPALTKRLCGILQDLLDILVSLYMLTLMVLLPLYTTETGYRYIGTEKCLFFRSASLTACKVILPLAVVWLFCRLLRRVLSGGREAGKRFILSATDGFALVYLAAVLCSYLHTSFREQTQWGDALYGALGWYLGLVTQLLFLAVYFMVSRLWQRRNWMMGLWTFALGIVTLMGYLNRFGINPLHMEGASPQYISTIGNINWYCGYIVTVMSLLTYYLWREWGKAGKKRVHMAGLLVLGIGMASLVTQGSSSGIVALLILAGVFYLLSMRDAGKLRLFWAGCMLLSGVCLLTWGIRRIWPQAITYTEGTTELLTGSLLPFFMMGVSLTGWLLVYRSSRAGRFHAGIWSLVGVAAWTAAGTVLTLYFVLLAVNTRHPGSIGVLSKVKALTFDASWGSNRGITWTAGLTCFLDQNALGKMVGVGPDAMAMYIHSGVNPALKQMVEEYFGRLMLTNAHNEWLTVLINEGLLGAVGYIGLMLTAICRFLKAGREDALAGAAGMGILAYTVNNLFSFQQVMSTSAVFLLLGIGEACLRSHEKDSRDG